MLADPWRELRDAVRHVQAVHADETSWRLRGETNWLWVAASALMACYRIDPSRSQAAAKELLGEDFGSFIITDRYAGYHWLDVLQQQLCWCHAIRQFVSLSERDGAPGRLGHELLAAAHQVIAAHREYLQNGHELTWLDAQLRPSRDTIETLLQRRGPWPSSEDPPVLRRHVGRVRRALDLLRSRGSIPRTTPLSALCVTGCCSERSSSAPDRRTEPLDRTDLHARETCRLQGRSILGYLQDAATAAHHRQPIPSLTPT